MNSKFGQPVEGREADARRLRIVTRGNSMSQMGDRVRGRFVSLSPTKARATLNKSTLVERSWHDVQPPP